MGSKPKCALMQRMARNRSRKRKLAGLGIQAPWQTKEEFSRCCEVCTLSLCFEDMHAVHVLSTRAGSRPAAVQRHSTQEVLLLVHLAAHPPHQSHDRVPNLAPSSPSSPGRATSEQCMVRGHAPTPCCVRRSFQGDLDSQDSRMLVPLPDSCARRDFLTFSCITVSARRAPEALNPGRLRY